MVNLRRRIQSTRDRLEMSRYKLRDVHKAGTLKDHAPLSSKDRKNALKALADLTRTLQARKGVRRTQS